MANADVFAMNVLFGNFPKGMKGNTEAAWEQIETQANLVLEEAKELAEAVKQRNMEEVLKELCDVWVVREYMDDLLQACSVKFSDARDAVMKNNLAKVFSSLEEAQETVNYYYTNGVFSYIDVVEYINKDYFIVKRLKDNKVLKPKGHSTPSLSQFIPEEWKQ